MTEPKDISFSDLYSYLVLTIDGEFCDYYINNIVVNDLLKQTFDKLKLVDDPSNIFLAIPDEQYKCIINILKFMPESIDKVDLECLNKQQMLEKHRDCFELD